MPHPHLPSWSDMTECSIDRKLGRNRHLYGNTINKPWHDKMYKKVCVPSEELRSASASAQSDQSSLCSLWVGNDAMLLRADSRLIRLRGCAG